jgi:hypothetical protein
MASVKASVGDSVGALVWDLVWDSVWDSVRDSVGDSVYGQHDANWLAFYRFFRDELGLIGETQKLKGLWELCQSAGWALPCEKVCFISERHSVLKRDENGRLHCADGPALAYPDGFKLYKWHGADVPEWAVKTPEKISAEAIAAERNAETRRALLEMFGREKLLAHCQKLQSDDWGALYRNAGILDVNGDPYCFVKVANATPEPDGSYKDYILRVAPACETAREAVASTFPRIRDFAPCVET